MLDLPTPPLPDRTRTMFRTFSRHCGLCQSGARFGMGTTCMEREWEESRIL